MKDYIAELQKKPYATRVKILWGGTAAFAIILVIIWSLSLKSTIKNSSGQPLIPQASELTSKDQEETDFLDVERTETTGNTLKIYFNLNNKTDDILNVSKTANIELVTNAGTFRPSKMTDRQGQTFVQKILSHTQNFGILTFSAVNDTKATLIFNEMFLEKNPNQLLKQTFELDFEKLNQDSQVRN